MHLDSLHDCSFVALPRCTRFKDRYDPLDGLVPIGCAAPACYDCCVRERWIEHLALVFSLLCFTPYLLRLGHEKWNCPTTPTVLEQRQDLTDVAHANSREVTTKSCLKVRSTIKNSMLFVADMTCNGYSRRDSLDKSM